MTVINVDDDISSCIKEKPEIMSVINIDDDISSCIKSIIGKGTSKFNAISVEDYFEDRDLQLAIMASTESNPKNFIDLSGENLLDFVDDDEIRVLRFKPSNTRFGKGRGRRSKPFSCNSILEAGTSSNSKNDPSFLCGICVEPKTAYEWYNIKGCSHSYCTDCITKYVASKLQENVTKIGCPVPDCKGCLEPEYCRSILPTEVFNRWADTLCEAVILGSKKFYCPFKDCSMMMIDDGKEKVVESECPSCCRLFCSQCKAAWHSGVDCGEFQKLNKDEREREDIMLMKLAQKKLWKRCPNCKIYVEKSQDCLFMTCRLVCLFLAICIYFHNMFSWNLRFKMYQT